MKRQPVANLCMLPPDACPPPPSVWQPRKQLVSLGFNMRLLRSSVQRLLAMSAVRAEAEAERREQEQEQGQARRHSIPCLCTAHGTVAPWHHGTMAHDIPSGTLRKHQYSWRCHCL